MLITEMITLLENIKKEDGDGPVWFCCDGEWVGLLESDISFNEGDDGDDPGLYIGA